MNMSDIIKRSFLEGFEGNTDIGYIAAAFGICCLLSLYIFFVYRHMTKNTFYSQTFNISLVAIAIIITGIIFTIQSSLIISLGMVGALSIVRFRTAIKDPMDLVFLFWSIAVGIVCGAGLARIAIIMSLVVTVAVMLLNRMPLSRTSMMLVVNAQKPDMEKAVLEIVNKFGNSYKVRSRSITGQTLDMVVEVRISDEAACVQAISELEDITSVSLLSHDGEVTY